jgi:hypothetical protein
MSNSEMLVKLREGKTEEVVQYLQQLEEEYETWVNRQEESWAVARELNSSAEQVEELPW